MALPSSGTISLNDVATEFGGAVPHAISEYYGADTGVPASGTISLSDFYGTSAFTPAVINYAVQTTTNEYFSRTMGSPTDYDKWTQSFWLKRTANSRNIVWQAGGTSGNNYSYCQIDNYSGSYKIMFIMGRDPTTGSPYYAVPSNTINLNQWYHYVFAFDAANGTASNRMRVWIDGTQISSFTTFNTFPQNFGAYWNKSGQAHYIARYGGLGLYSNMDITRFHFVDGQSLDASSFGAFNSGNWYPMPYTGSYGNNGFFLSMDNTVDFGQDDSGNGNSWNRTNITSADATTSVPAFV